MRRQDIKVGVEYAATGPLAYGREPNTPPRRVRFTDTRPGPWGRIVTLRKAMVPSVVNGIPGPVWVVAMSEIVHITSDRGSDADRSLPHDIHAAKALKYGRDVPYERKTIGGKVQKSTRRVFDEKAIPLGAEITCVEFSVKGGLPGEVYRRNQETNEWEWWPTLVQPADIHRTWAEVEQKDSERAARNAELDRAAKVAEIEELLAAVGLNYLFEADRLGHGTAVEITARSRDADTIMRMASEWLHERKPKGWTRAVNIIAVARDAASAGS